MGNVLVLYHSESGHTERMAGFVAEGVRDVESVEVRMRSVSEASMTDLLWADGIAVGAPTYTGVVSWQMKRFWDEVVQEIWGEMDGKIGCAFSSSGGWGGGSELTCMSILTMLMNVGMLTFGVPDYTGHQFTLHYGAVTAGNPQDDAEVEACRRLGKRLAQWVAALVDGRAEARPGCMKDRA